MSKKSFFRPAGRHRRSSWRAPAFAVKVARRLKARRIAARSLPYRPARQIALEVRRREGERLGGRWRV
ncbi:hypothetical protein KDK95_30950 [Actinospica sp. MGRD01-02]|uniref:Uncharacterized protein n=1 Tax=Actinospica acidithermotolerans TaxID=2828514 RepID=A0A941EG13_9ACTN|nr:hypothetical protein [Actinospica acidithermotolerans]MBR7830762.1 hypothetical protein [Actinospica acidithermotolerans]